jgi:hypothetical protein
MWIFSLTFLLLWNSSSYYSLVFSKYFLKGFINDVVYFNLFSFIFSVLKFLFIGLGASVFKWVVLGLVKGL